MRTLVIAIALAALVTGCGKATDEAINGGFDESFAATCVSSSERNGLARSVATQVCKCAIEGINKQFSEIEKLTMSADDATPIMMACLRKTVK